MVWFFRSSRGGFEFFLHEGEGIAGADAEERLVKGDRGVGRGVGRDLCGGGVCTVFRRRAGYGADCEEFLFGDIAITESEVDVFRGASQEQLAIFAFDLEGRRSGRVNPGGRNFRLFPGGSGDFFAGGSIHRIIGFFFIELESSRRASQAGVVGRRLHDPAFCHCPRLGGGKRCVERILIPRWVTTSRKGGHLMSCA